MQYRCVTTSVEGFVQQLAVAYITHGYWFYVTGSIPEGKDPATVDAKLIERYGIAISKWARCRRKRRGLANMQYLRHERFFVLLATKGRHEFFERERASFRDVRRTPVKFAGYSISCRKSGDGQWHVSVRIAESRYLEVKARFNEIAQSRSIALLEGEFLQFSAQRFSPVRRQLLSLLRAVNRRRRVASLPLVEIEGVSYKRKIVRPFAHP